MATHNIINENMELIYNNRIHLARCGNLKIPVNMPDGEIIDFMFNVKFDGKPTDVRFRSFEKDGNFTVEFIMNNFGTELGSYTKMPINVGKYNNRNIEVLFAMNKPANGLPILDVTIYLEASKNEK